MSTKLFAVGLTLVVIALPAGTQAMLVEDFDGGGTTPFAFQNNGGAPGPAVIGGGPTGSFARITYLSGGNNRSIAFDEEPSASGPAIQLDLSFDFRMTDDATNTASGGCCGFAADGLGIGLFDVGTYGATGPSNPSVIAVKAWERPSMGNAFTVGLDIFPGGGGNNVTLNWAGAQVGDIDPGFSLNSNVFHRAHVRVTRNGTDADVNLSIIEDVHGAAIPHAVFANHFVSGMDLLNLFRYRLIAGGRTGGAWNEGDLDNISLAAVVPEPSTFLIWSLGLLGLAWYARRRRTK